MPKTRELFRVGTPLRATTLVAMLDAVSPSDDAIVRHYHGSLIVEEPAVELGANDEHAE